MAIDLQNAPRVPQAQWEWCSDSFQWTPYSPSCCATIETAFSSGASVSRVHIDRASYDIIFQPFGLRQRNLTTGRTRPVRREISGEDLGVVWQWWDKENLQWHAYDTGLVVRLEEKWTECTLSKILNKQNGPAGLIVTINNRAYGIEFETDAVQYSIQTHYVRGVRRRTKSDSNTSQGELAMPHCSNQLEFEPSASNTPVQSLLSDDINGFPCSFQYLSSAVAESRHDTADKSFFDNAHFVNWSNPPESKDCSICLSSLGESKAVMLAKCRHSFHGGCIQMWFKNRPTCPECLTVYGVINGCQPPGEMNVHYLTFGSAEARNGLAGYPNTDVIKITYRFPSGIQTAEHPNPGKRYAGTVRIAFLPKNTDGEEVLELLQKAWSRRLLFRVGTSVTTGRSDVIIWSGVHHKTQMTGGSSYHGYPDETYLTRVKEELADVGVI